MLIPEADVKELLNHRGFPAISIYVPTVRAGKEVQQNTIILKNSINDAEDRLEKLGYRQPELRKLISPIQTLLDSGLFREERSDGFALFQAEGAPMRYYHLPLHFQSLTVVSDIYHISPLLPLLDGNTISFYLLAISQNNVRLLKGDMFSILEINIPGLPGNLAEAVPSIVPEKTLQFHTGAPPVSGARRAAIFHGHGANIDAEKDNITRFCRRVNEALHDELKETEAPLILAGPEPVLPMFRDIAEYQNIPEVTISGNPELVTDTELHKKALQILSPGREQWRAVEINKFNQLHGTGKTLDNPEHIVTAACGGRVDTLMVASEEHCWGKLDRQNLQVELHTEPEPDDTDLLNVAVMETLMNGGTAFNVTPEEIMVNGEPRKLTAVLRF